MCTLDKKWLHQIRLFWLWKQKWVNLVLHSADSELLDDLIFTHQIVIDGWYHRGITGAVSEGLATDGLLREHSGCPTDGSSSLSLPWLHVVMDSCTCQDGSIWRATTIINDRISFPVKLLWEKYLQLNVQNVFIRESHKVCALDSCSRCQPLAQGRSIELDNM